MDVFRNFSMCFSNNSNCFDLKANELQTEKLQHIK